ncbi:MAG TPA: NADH-quinone oxidoreductase subunit I [Acidimicrobiales bacterium]|jgi:NADH-quinone oxidoreductase subunit I|nr:NADH-quinone oxidoreductase subunit I [Acidimicrobiales bacterium]
MTNAVTGLLKGMAITARELKDTITKGPVTVQYPRVKEAPAPRSRGVIALKEENCTVCMLCARQCPVWCIYIEGHKDFRPPKREGGKPSSWNYLDRFDIDYSLCMYCGICVEVCPFDALHWTPEYEYSDLTIEGLLHDMQRLGEWEATVPEQPDYEKGSQVKVAKKK